MRNNPCYVSWKRTNTKYLGKIEQDSLSGEPFFDIGCYLISRL